jgi:hypothetical protein
VRVKKLITEFRVSQTNLMACSCCGTPINKGALFCDCIDCGAIFCKECATDGSFEEHECEEEPYGCI